MNERELKALEDLCPFCGKETGEVSIVLAPQELVAQTDKAIGNACPKCEKLLKSGCLGFLSPSGEGIIIQRDKGVEILELLQVRHLLSEEKDLMTVIRVEQDFWDRQFKSIVDRRMKTKKKKRSHS